MHQMSLLLAHQALADACDFGVSAEGEVLSNDDIEKLMEAVTRCSREAMGLITVGKQYLKDNKDSGAASSASGMTPRVGLLNK